MQSRAGGLILERDEHPPLSQLHSQNQFSGHSGFSASLLTASQYNQEDRGGKKVRKQRLSSVHIHVLSALIERHFSPYLQSQVLRISQLRPATLWGDICSGSNMG